MKKIKMFKFLKALIAVTAINFLNFAATAMEQSNSKQQDQKIVEEKKLEKDMEKEKVHKAEKKPPKEVKNSEKQQKLEKKEPKNKGKGNEKEKQSGEKNKEDVEHSKEQGKQKIEKNIKDHERVEKDQIRKNEKKYKDFNPENFQVAGYELIVHKKAGVPLLEYVHKNTNARFVFIPVEKKYLSKLTNSVFFGAFSKDDSGIIHLGEHCFGLETERNYKKIKEKEYKQLNAQTSPYGLEYIYSANMPNGESYVKDLLKDLQDPEVFKNPKIFAVEKKRVVNELKFFNSVKESISPLNNLLYYNESGEVNTVKGISLENLKKLHRKIFHPSNMCVIEYVDLDKKNIKKYLEGLDEILDKSNDIFLKTKGSDKFSSKFKYKQKEKYSRVKWPANSQEIFPYYNAASGSGKKRRFGVFFLYDLNELKFNAAQKESLTINFDKLYNASLSNAIAKLGYHDVRFIPNLTDTIEFSKGTVQIYISTDDENLIREDVLTKNVQKIIKLIKDEIKQKNYEDLLQIKSAVDYFLGHSVKKDGLNFSNSHIYGERLDLIDMGIKQSFARFKVPFSKNLFNVDENNEIIYNIDHAVNLTKDNLNSYDVLAEKGPSYIIAFEQDKTNKDQKNLVDFEHEEFMLPIKFSKDTKSKAVFYIACKIFNSYLNEQLNFENGLTYMEFFVPRYFFDVVSRHRTNEQSKKEILDYVGANFESLIKNLKLSRKDFDEIKQDEKEIFNKNYALKFFENYISRLEKLEKELELFCKNEDDDKLKIINKNATVSDLIKHLPHAFVDLISFFESYDEYLKCLKFNNKILRYTKNFKNKDKIKLNKNNVKELKENLKIKEHIEYFKKHFEFLKEIYNSFDSVKYEDVTNLLKSAKLLKEDELKRFQKNSSEIQKEHWLERKKIYGTS